MSFKRDTCWPRRLSNQFWLISFYYRNSLPSQFYCHERWWARRTLACIYSAVRVVCFVIVAATTELTFKFDRNYHVRQNRRGGRVENSRRRGLTFRKSWHELRARRWETSRWNILGYRCLKGNDEQLVNHPDPSAEFLSPGGALCARNCAYELTRFVQLSAGFAGYWFLRRGSVGDIIRKSKAGEKLITIMLHGRQKETKHDAIDPRRFEPRIIKLYARSAISELVIPMLIIARLRNYPRLNRSYVERMRFLFSAVRK